MKSNFFAIKLTAFLASLTFFSGCAGSSNGDDLEVPTNLPPICRDIDFVANPDMREMCGVRKAHNKAYKNIPQQLVAKNKHHIPQMKMLQQEITTENLQ